MSLGSRPYRRLPMGRGGRHAGWGSLWSFAWVGLALTLWSSDMAPGPSGPIPAGLEARLSRSGSSGPSPRKSSGWAKAKEPLVVTGPERQGPLLPCAPAPWF